MEKLTTSALSAQAPSGVEWALYAAQCGHRVFPLIPGRGIPYAIETTAAALGLNPNDPAGLHHARADEPSIRALWSGDRANAQIGLAMGDGLLAIDLDEKDGKSGSATLAANGWTIPATASQRTRNGGSHHLVTVPHGTRAETDAGELGAGIDRRGDGGYIVLYDPAILTAERTPAPQWALAPGKGKADRLDSAGAMRAPSYEVALAALRSRDPDELERGQWLAFSGAFYTATVDLVDDAIALADWQDWNVAHGETNDPTANARTWSDFARNGTSGDFATLARMAAPGDPAKAYVAFGFNGPPPVPAGARTAANDTGSARAISATPYSWRDPRTLPPRPWMLGHWVLKGEVTAIVAPGGTGKSTIGAGIGLSLATARPLLGKRVHDGPHAAWLFNLEDGIDELERQVGAATIHHGIEEADCGDRLFLDSGITQPLKTATETRDGFTIDESTFDQLAATIRSRGIGAVIVDPFISSHTVSEASNEAIDAIVKRWKRLAQETGCAVVLVHHTKKLGGREATAEDGRGAVALRDAARVVLALNPMGESEGKKLGVSDPFVRRSIVRVDMGKANRAPAENAAWIKLEGQDLGNGTTSRPADDVAVATAWERPDLLHGFTSEHLRELQAQLEAQPMRKDVQATEWVGNAVAKIAGLETNNEEHVARIKAVLAEWITAGSLATEHRDNGKGGKSPFVICGRPVDQMPGTMPAR